ncbi:winged helix DNA-binding domain-containing protein [Basidiobolus meristosporus CBS 931.73]|uniref:Winged helix DNA-binding domain-containing protein n=1 Tax=Basidiobolus meristosporus CBS 931.73 TaxID=1314790 RepID=A0A1Y1Y619_9FUNG|nr:winged helix DNA-binding domain-containing protein [Basidiobolus meristosporus CBS 931.73]|eukprot:ORX93409.1 winged helix DNA-binding domain-containing protein [Basidiobolus meristosporus CBS 931.73]
MDDNSLSDSTQDISLFVLKLYRILESDKYTRFIRWSASGDSFIIQDSTLFATVVLPIFFKTSIFTSFVRQLNKYDFRRISDARRGKASTNHSASAFSHINFRQNRIDLLHLITRQPAKLAVPDSVVVPRNPGNLTSYSESCVEDCSSDNSSVNECTEEIPLQRNLSFPHETRGMGNLNGDSPAESGEKCSQCQKLLSERALLEQLAQQLQNNILAKVGNPTTTLKPNMRTGSMAPSLTKFQKSEILNPCPVNPSSYGNFMWPFDGSLQTTPHSYAPLLDRPTNLQCPSQPNPLLSPWLSSGPTIQGGCEFHFQSQAPVEENLPVSLYNWYTQDSFES